MNKSSIKQRLSQKVGGADFINPNQLKKAMGWGNDRTYRCLKGLDFIRSERTKQYDIDEVAAAIMESVVKGGNI